MALLHRAEIRPAKLELLRDWVPTQPWYVGGANPDLHQLGAYRFDDPAGEVGVETLVVRAGEGAVFQVPLTYRAAPVEGLESHLICTMQHSVLGDRWIYDASGDPIYASALATAILTGGTQAELERDDGTGVEVIEPSVRVKGSGDADTDLGAIDLVATSHTDEGTLIVTSVADLIVLPQLAGGPSVTGDQTLTGDWGDSAEPTLLAVARLR